MKRKIRRRFFLSAMIISSLSMGSQAKSPAAQLHEKLSIIKHFSTDFQQKVISPQGKVIYRSKGKLVVAKLGRFNWQTSAPDRAQIVSDGTNVWYYDPMVAQVTVYSTTDTIAHTPFMLLADQRPEIWRMYKVKLAKSSFYISSILHPQQPTLRIYFNHKGKISKFGIIEDQGQRSEFKLMHFRLNPKVAPREFHFNLPKEVSIDDQRVHK